MSDNIVLPEVIKKWVEEINDPSTPIWLRENYAIKLESLQLFLGTELDKFKREMLMETRKANRKAIRKK